MYPILLKKTQLPRCVCITHGVKTSERYVSRVFLIYNQRNIHNT